MNNIVEILLEKGAIPTKTLKRAGVNKDPLYVALENKKYGVVKTFLKNPDYIKHVNMPMLSQILDALVHEDKVELIDDLLEGSNKERHDIINDIKVKSMMSVCEKGKGDILNSLIKKWNFSVNCSNQYGYTPLLVASKFGDAVMVKTLLEAGADINYKKENGDNAFIEASRNCDISALKILLDYNSYQMDKDTLTVCIKEAGNRLRMEDRVLVQQKKKGTIDLLEEAREPSERWSPIRSSWVGTVMRAVPKPQEGVADLLI
jgi:ankyrin repeat protein